MKIELIGKPEVIMSNPRSIHNYFAWPTVARLQNGKIAVTASGFRLGHLCPFGKMVISYSEDEGRSYTVPAPLIDTVLDDRDGGILPFGEKGVLVTSANNRVQHQKNYLDHRKERGAAVENIDYCREYLNMITPEQEDEVLGAEFRISLDGGVTFGPILRSPVTSPHGPTQLRDGTILWVGRPYGKHAAEDVRNAQAYRVNPDGTMELLGEIEAPDDDNRELHEPYSFELEDGTILCQFRAEPCFTTYQAESTDGGRTWTKVHPLLGKYGGAPSHIMRHSSGVLISAYGFRQAPRGGVRIMFSTDEGKTWDTDHILYENSDNHIDLGYPSTVELKDGTLLTVFYAHINDGQTYSDPGVGPTAIWQQKWRLIRE